MNAHIQVRDYLLYDPPVIYGHTPLSEATELLCRHHLTGLPVVDEHKKLIGFLSEQDCIQKLLGSSYHCDFDVLASDVMRKEVLTASPSESIITLAESMQNNKPKIYPVVEEGRLIGVNGRTQILTALREQLKARQVPV
ncbi:CBS domain-containing protein [uncultured Endozoicomonas sp.]|uniref:CBS domain-containing protein n=1 Tax=uncultured Endozoicomonas sp. TaxID=432652 RepID=UPI00261E6570|nr:CBS domain-containing protein [uncultured Endozoicomonas sp.]